LATGDGKWTPIDIEFKSQYLDAFWDRQPAFPGACRRAAFDGRRLAGWGKSHGIDGLGGGFEGDYGFGEAHAGGLFHHGQGGGAVVGLPAIEARFADGFFGLGSFRGGSHGFLCGKQCGDVGA